MSGRFSSPKTKNNPFLRSKMITGHHHLLAFNTLYETDDEVFATDIQFEMFDLILQLVTDCV